MGTASIKKIIDRNSWTEKFPAALSIMMLFIVEALNFFDVVPQQRWEAFETASNLLIAVLALISFFWGWLFSPKSRSSALNCTLCNLAVPTVAFFVNIDVFEHTIRWEQFPSGLWGWHYVWIVWAIMQIVLMSGFGKCLLDQIRTFLNWGKEIVTSLGRAISQLAGVIEDGDKRTVFTIIGGFAINTVYFGWQIAEKGVYAALSDADTLLGSVRLWLLCIFIGFLLHIIPSTFSKAGDALKNMESKKVLAAVGIIIAFALLVYALPVLLGMLGNIIIVLMLLTGLFGLAAKRAIKKDKNPPPGKDSTIKNIDVIVLLLAFIVIPLTTACVGTAVSPKGRDILATQDKTDLTTWLNFWGAVLEVTNGFLQLFGIG